MLHRTKKGFLSMLAAGVLTAGLVPGTAAAHGGWDDDDDDDQKLTSQQRKLVKTLRDVTDEYRWLDEAIEDGYKKASECVEKKGVGAMGFHYAKNSLIDAKTDARKPEVLVYMPNKQGRYKLVAVEFLSTAKKRPEIAGLKFENGPFPGTFALHAWVWKENPDGMFAAYNPAHRCPKK
ncbi:hypothetical protein [Arthrobacter sp. ISL-28]|uniref:hypothetical protein n=1 Tax=Arthrobacter sp. ISL-28 TaxID=2819108 RepID=UPI001BE7126B|nr:hypothetical protein [Arthrobacter sp. ISL-28]MBT2519835.1 hypothetical protein [Arthrobacter sp. ISL-28]